MHAPRFRITELARSERPVQLRLPFRFGAATLRECPQAFVHVRIELADGRSAEGCAGELMVPKWFDKNPALSNAQDIEQLRQSLHSAAKAYGADGAPRTAWGHFEAHYEELLAAGTRAGQQALVTNYGGALIDRALLDALCHLFEAPFAAALRANLPGIQPGALATDLRDFDIGAFLADLAPQNSIAARHTVGLLDAIRDADAPADAPRDGLPVSLEGAIARYGHDHFKLKLSGQTDADLARLAQIAGVLDGRAVRITLDGNEQYTELGSFADFHERFTAAPALRALAAKVAFVEQPLRRDISLETDIHALARRVPLLIDEADATLDAFVTARALGYRGVSSKSCKGLYKSVVNAARIAQWNASSPAGDRGTFFMSAEDLTMQAGVAVQQDLALVAMLGLPDVERNGHHYVDGMSALSSAEQQAFLAAHPDLYEHSHGAVRLNIRAGRVTLGSLLAAPGFASAAWPDRASLTLLT